MPGISDIEPLSQEGDCDEKTRMKKNAGAATPRQWPYLLALADKLGNLPFLLSVQRGLALSLPLIMVGSLALMLKDLPLPALQNMLDASLGLHWRVACVNLISGSFGIASLAMLCAYSGVRTALHNQHHAEQMVSPTMTTIVVLSCFFIITAPAETHSWKQLFSLDHGLLIALMVAAIASSLYLKLSRVSFLQLPFGVVGHDPVVRDVLTVMPAGMATLLLFALLRLLVTAIGVSDISESACELLAGLLDGPGDWLGLSLAYTGLSQLLWFFGAHGPNILFFFEEHILIPAGLANSSAIQLGEIPPYIITKSFLDVFTRMGGSGCTLSLILALVMQSRDAGNRKLCLFALLPSLCNVNEPLLFAIPLVLNPVYMIPFLLTPLVQMLTAYTATALELIPHTTAAASWTTPAVLSGFIATGSIAGSIMQLMNLSLGTAIYLPFVQLADRLRERQGRRILESLLQAATSCNVGPNGCKCLDRPGEEGRIAKTLANDLARALASDDQLFLEYQPQIDATSNQVHGVEALLRWRHPAYGLIPPPITVALAEDTDCIEELGLFVLSEACAQRAAWKGLVPADLIISVNVAPLQMQDPLFTRKVLHILDKADIAPGLLEVEITESTILEPDSTMLTMLHHLRRTGVRVAIDDFGMGHTSLRYLREFPVDTVKIDRSLTQGNHRGVNEHIVRSIVELSRTLGFMTVVEGVERDEQLRDFLALGCRVFQGYLFSRPVAGEDCLAFIRKNGGIHVGSAVPRNQISPILKAPAFTDMQPSFSGAILFQPSELRAVPVSSRN